MAAIDDLRAQLDEIEAAETQLDELSAVDELWNLVDRLRRTLILAAHEAGYPHSAIGSAAGRVTKQAIQKLLSNSKTRRTEP